MQQPRSDDISNAGDVQHRDKAGPAAAGTALRWTAPATLDLSIHRRSTVIELDVSGELDMATAPRLGDAMAWLRLSSSPATTIVINTSGVHFIAVAGYRALLSAPVGPDGLWDPSRLHHRGTGRRQARGRDLRRLGPPAPGAGQGRPVGVGRPRRVALVAPRADGRDEPLASVPTVKQPDSSRSSHG
jgi:hypothetical protein